MYRLTKLLLCLCPILFPSSPRPLPKKKSELAFIEIQIFIIKYSCIHHAGCCKYSSEDSQGSQTRLILPVDQIFNILSQDPLQNCKNRNILLKVDPDKPCRSY